MIYSQVGEIIEKTINGGLSAVETYIASVGVLGIAMFIIGIVLTIYKGKKYGIDKEAIEKAIQEQKEAYNKKYEEQNREFENKLKAQQQAYSEALLMIAKDKSVECNALKTIYGIFKEADSLSEEAITKAEKDIEEKEIQEQEEAEKQEEISKEINNINAILGDISK